MQNSRSHDQPEKSSVGVVYLVGAMINKNMKFVQ
jgi:hypothetical protein